MMVYPNVFLIGMPGVGKTYLGQQWAKAHGFAFIDLDDAIVHAYGCSISDIIIQKGEGEFRNIEQQILHKIGGQQEAQIIACGGGTPCFHDNMHWMLQQGIVVLIKYELLDLVNNLQADQNKRPLLLRYGNDTHGLLQGLTLIWNERKLFYLQAHHILEVNDEIDSKFAEIISRINN